MCLRPIRYVKGMPSPVKKPEKLDMVIFRENSEDIYAGIEWQAETPEARKVIDFLQNEMDVTKIRFPKPPESASSQSRAKVRSGLFGPRWIMRFPTNARALPSCTRQHHEIH